MALHVASTNRVLTTEQDALLAREVLNDLDGPEGALQVTQRERVADAIPPQVGRILQQVLQVMATGGSVTIMSTPPELTTSSAAAILGVSRPTLMKMIADHLIPAHKVGTHTRLRSEDVLEELRARRQRERAAFEALRQLTDDV